MADEASEPTLEPGVLAVEAYHEELAYQRRKNWTILGAALCALGGAGVMFAILFFGTDLFRSKPPTTSALVEPPIKSQIPVQSMYTPDQAADIHRQSLSMYHVDIVGPKPPETNAQGKPQTGSQPAPKNMPPFNPFAGGSVPEGWSGQGPIKGQVAVKPEGGAEEDNSGKPAPDTNPPQIAAKGALLVGRSRGGDPEGEARDIAAALQGIGGSVRTANHFSLAGGVIGVQVIATFPATALAQARAKLAAQGIQLEVSEQTPGQRSSHVAGILNDRISDLKKDRAGLEEKYLSDAPEIAQIDEEIQNLTAALSAVRSVGKSQKIAVALIAVGSL